MRRIETLNSVYEVDVDASKIRRVSGVNEPTPSFGTDGEWREFDSFAAHPEGRLVVHWSPGRWSVSSLIVSDETV